MNANPIQRNQIDILTESASTRWISPSIIDREPAGCDGRRPAVRIREGSTAAAKPVAGSSSLRAVLVAACLLGGQTVAHAQVRAGVVGGNGGVPFVAMCPAGDVLIGAIVRSGSWIDSASSVCTEAKAIGVVPRHLVEGIGGGGGPGGNVQNELVCDSTEVVTALEATSGVVQDNIRAVTRMRFRCTRPAGVPHGFTSGETVTLGGPDQANPIKGYVFCATGQVALGIYSKGGKWLDQLGLICGKLP